MRTVCFSAEIIPASIYSVFLHIRDALVRENPEAGKKKRRKEVRESLSIKR
jgi:hypothetical protein